MCYYYIIAIILKTHEEAVTAKTTQAKPSEGESSGKYNIHNIILL